MADLQSPLFQALSSRRRQRQELIRSIESQTGRRLLVYYANVNLQKAEISPLDVAPFQDLLYDCENECDLDLLLQSPGGDIDTAEKLVYMTRKRARSLRVIVVERAKSAATMIALAADEILMSSTSELGPIDPQITTFSADGQPVSRPARSFLDGLELVKKSVDRDGYFNAAYYPILNQVDPALLDLCSKAIQRSQQFAEKWLLKHMLAGDAKGAKKIASRLVDVELYRSHRMVIDWEEARDIGLKVRYIPADDPLWKLLWSLHIAYQMECVEQSLGNVYETGSISLQH